MCVCVCVCVCVFVRVCFYVCVLLCERERETHRKIETDVMNENSFLAHATTSLT